MKDVTENWFKIAQYDLKVAESNFREGYYIKVVENCHTSLEKLLKAIIAEQKDSNPPKIHDLLKLTSITVIGNIQEEITSLLDELGDLYLSTRYPEDFDLLNEKINRDRANKLLNSSKEAFKWFQKHLN